MKIQIDICSTGIPKELKSLIENERRRCGKLIIKEINYYGHKKATGARIDFDDWWLTGIILEYRNQIKIPRF